MGGEVGHNEAARLSRANVVERSRFNDRQAVALPVDVGQLPGGQLADAIGVARPGDGLLGQRHGLAPQHAVDLGAGDNDHARPAERRRRPQDVGRAAGVDGHRQRRVVPGARRVGLPGQVEDNIRPRLGQRGDHRRRVKQIAIDGPDAWVGGQLLMTGGGVDERGNFMAVGQQAIDKM